MIDKLLKAQAGSTLKLGDTEAIATLAAQNDEAKARIQTLEGGA